MAGGGGPRTTCRNFMGTEYFNDDFTTESVLSHLAHGACAKDPTWPLLPRLALGIRVKRYIKIYTDSFIVHCDTYNTH